MPSDGEQFGDGLNHGHNCPASGHICAPERGFTVQTAVAPDMVSKNQIEEEELTTQDVLDSELETPRQEVEIYPEWEEHPEEAPGENVRIEDGTLIWERDGFEARMESYETTHWRVELDIPHTVAKWYPRTIDLKCLPLPEHGFVSDVEVEDYESVGATLVIQDNFQPTFEVNQFIDKLLENAESSEEFQNEINEKLENARQNEE